MIKFVLALAFIATTVFSFIAGGRLGAEAYILADAKYKAALLVAELNRFERDGPEAVQESLESYLDMSLQAHGRSEDSFLQLLWPELQIAKEGDAAHKAIVIAASYRKRHPQSWYGTLDRDGIAPEARALVKQTEKEIQAVVEKYAE